ncbi:MAG TPA: transglycosylase SLT domain-containing protein [Polyangiaceae bacterium]
MAFQNPCGGKAWELLASGEIAIQGEGTPVLAPTSAAATLMLQNWTNWASMLRAAASKYGVPVTWLLAIATMETGPWSKNPLQQAGMISPAGAVGVMQIMPATASMLGVAPGQLTDPAVNIDAGAKLVAQLAAKNPSGLPAISAAYNSGKVCGCAKSGCNEWNLYADANYPRRVIEWNNTAIAAGLGSSFGPSMLPVFGAALGASLALVVVGRRKRRRA